MRARKAALAGILLLAVTGCSAQPPAAAPSSTAVGDGHGEIAGAHELAEPALHLATANRDGFISHLDLLDEETSVLAEIDPIDELVTDGRYLFGIREGSVTVIDSGVWTWSHVDHFHYYEAPSRILGDIEGAGIATVVPGDSGIGILFDHEAVLLDAPALADGEISERFRIDVEPHAGLVVPLGEGAAITDPESGASGAVSSLRIVDADGTDVGSVPCADAAATITTVVGVVVGCADGAVMATGADPASWERIPYPAGTENLRATAFAAREARPTVAAVAGDSGVWMLDTREREWTLIDLEEPIVLAAAVDDADERVLALASDGSVLVIQDAAVVSRTAPLVAASLADAASAEHVEFVVDQTRAYLNGPAEGMMWEIDPADDARLARTFETEAEPLLLAGTGR
ncbi:hypothetical protein ACWGJP_08030 [Microbacterium sp. NPDC055903]